MKQAETRKGSPTRETLIEIRGVTKTYPTQSGEPVQALRETNLDIYQHEFVSVLGPSGCGKSTLMMMVAGLIPCSSGTIRIRNVPLQKPYTEAGIVFQQDVLMPWRTILDNILIQAEFRNVPPQHWEERARQLIELVGLKGFEDRYPRELSGGMRQRVSICRALVHDPHLLLMDEPFGALDALTRDQMNLDIQHIWQQSKKTVLFITHSISEAVFLSDRVLVFGPRPGGVELELHIDLPRPRSLQIRETQEFSEYVTQIRETFTQMGVIREYGDGSG